MHAEIESHLETIALRVLEGAKRGADKGTPGRVIFSVLGCYMAGEGEHAIEEVDRVRLSGKPWKTTQTEWIQLCYSQMRRLIANNHGLTEKHVIRLFGPMGLETSTLDSVWLASLDDLGKRRGQVAHTGIGLHVLRPASDHRALVQSIIQGLPDFREKVSDLA